MIERGKPVLSRDELIRLQTLRAEVDSYLRTEWPGARQHTFTRPKVDTMPVEVKEQGRPMRVEWL